MENASKALIIAGSVLISVLIISMLVFLYKNVIDFKRTESTREEVKKIYEYNKKIEMFDKPGLYGSEILSLSNLIEDYNRTQHELKEYKKIDLEVKIDSIISAYYLKDTEYLSYKDLNKIVNQLNEDINLLKTTKLNKLNDDTIKEIVKNDTNIDRAKIIKLNKNKYSNLTLDRISNMRENEKEIIFENDEDKEIASDLADFYASIKTEFSQFKNKKFQKPEIEYDQNNGRIVKMIFKEVGL